MLIAVIDKQPSRNDYSKYFNFEFDLFHLCSTVKTKILKRDVDMVGFDPNDFDFVILIGSEATKFIVGLNSVGEKAGHLVKEKFIPLVNPAMMIFKPEAKPAFEESLRRLHRNISGDLVVKTHGEFLGLQHEESAEEYFSYILESDIPEVALDTETTGLYVRNCHVLGISISNGLRKGAYISADAMSETAVALLQKIIDTKTVIFHNAKFDISMLNYHFGLTFDVNKVHDTILMHYMLDESIGSHSLKDLALKYTDYGDYDKELDDFKKDYCKQASVKEADFTYDLIPWDIIYRYAAIDTAVTLELYYMFAKILFSGKSEKIKSVYYNLMLPGLFLLIDMESNGIPFSQERLNFAEKILSEKLLKATEELYLLPEIHEFEKEQGKVFNPNSPTQLRVLLFDKLGLTSIGKKTGTGMLSTDAEVLEDLEGDHPVVQHLMAIRKVSKIKNTYIDKLLQVLDMDSRVRTSFNITSTTSGRLSSSGRFNAQQLIRDDPIVKGCIVAKPGYKIISQDLKTAEMYYASVLSGDPKLQQVFIDGGDFHNSIAKSVFKLKCSVEEVKKLFPLKRQAAKDISFGILYGSGADKVASTVTKDSGEVFSFHEAEEVIEDYFSTFTKLRKWLDNNKIHIKQYGYIYSFFGRKRRLKNVFSPDKGIAAHEVRSGINFLVQSISSDINLFAAIDCNKRIKHLDAKLIMLVHDSIVAEVKEEHVTEFCAILKECTQTDRGISIKNCPIDLDVEIWDDYSFGKFEKVYGEKFKEYKISSIPNT